MHRLLLGGKRATITPFHQLGRKMALNIKNRTAEQLAHELASVTGESLTEAITVALRNRLEALKRSRQRGSVMAEVAALQEFLRSQPDRDTRSADEILGYDEFGLPR